MRDIALRLEDRTMKDPNSGCWLWEGYINRGGYGVIKVDSETTSLTHRTMWTIYRGVIPDGMHVCHKCDTPACINPDHLFLGTQLDNMRDASRKERIRRGEKSPRMKLTDAQVAEIRNSKVSSIKLGKLYGVTDAFIQQIRRGERRAHSGN